MRTQFHCLPYYTCWPLLFLLAHNAPAQEWSAVDNSFEKQHQSEWLSAFDHTSLSTVASPDVDWKRLAFFAASRSVVVLGQREATRDTVGLTLGLTEKHIRLWHTAPDDLVLLSTPLCGSSQGTKIYFMMSSLPSQRASVDPDTRIEIWEYDVDKDSWREIWSLTDGNILYPSPSPDGSLLAAYSSAQHRWEVKSLQTGTLRATVDYLASGPAGWFWESDTNAVISGRSEERLDGARSGVWDWRDSDKGQDSVSILRDWIVFQAVRSGSDLLCVGRPLDITIRDEIGMPVWILSDLHGGLTKAPQRIGMANASRPLRWQAGEDWGLCLLEGGVAILDSASRTYSMLRIDSEIEDVAGRKVAGGYELWMLINNEIETFMVSIDWPKPQLE